MSEVAAIDGLAFASNAVVLEGRLGMESLPRLAESGASGGGLHFVLTGEINERNKPGLRLVVDGSMRIVCQRCLGRLVLPVQLDVQLEFVPSEAEMLAAGDEVDRIVAGHAMSVAALVEDEVLLALPMVPRHVQCSSAARMDGGAKASSFQALAALRKTNRQGD